MQVKIFNNSYRAGRSEDNIYYISQQNLIREVVILIENRRCSIKNHGDRISSSFAPEYRKKSESVASETYSYRLLISHPLHSLYRQIFIWTDWFYTIPYQYNDKTRESLLRLIECRIDFRSIPFKLILWNITSVYYCCTIHSRLIQLVVFLYSL